MKFLKEHKGFISGPHMAPIPVAPSDELQQLREEFRLEKQSKAAVVESLRLLKMIKTELQNKVTKYEAETPSALLEQVVQWVAFVFYYCELNGWWSR